MTEYRLENGDGGVVELPSGTWRWFPVRVVALPEERCDSQVLILAHRDLAGSIIRVRVPPELSVINNQDLLQLVSGADEREVMTNRGRFVVRAPIGHGPDEFWLVRPDRGVPFRSNGHTHKQLADLTTEEIHEVVGHPMPWV